MWQFRTGLLHFLQTNNNCKNNFDSRIIWLDSLSLSERQTVQKSVSLLLPCFGFPPELTLSSFSLQRSFPGRPGPPSGSTQIKRQSPLKQNPNSFSMSACRQPCFRCIENQGILLIECLLKEILKIYFFFLTEDPSWFSVLWVPSKRDLTCPTPLT